MQAVIAGRGAIPFTGRAAGFIGNCVESLAPLVVKPDPLLETTAVRQRLHAVADEARGSARERDGAATGYYSLHAYSDATITETVRARADAGWAADTFPSMCSSFLWAMARRQGARLESSGATTTTGDIEPTDRRRGAEASTQTLDGLYHYDEYERRNAGDWLYSNVRQLVIDDQAGARLAGAPRRYANQVCNTFVNGDSSVAARRSDAWENPGPGTTVSPDDILHWDGPDEGGLWGYAEPLIYREPRTQTVQLSRWRQVLQTGRVTGTVTLDGRPIRDALVQLGGHSTRTDEHGRYVFENVGYGGYAIVASHTDFGIRYTGTASVHLSTDRLRVDIALVPPPERYRLAVIEYDFVGVDDEVRSDEVRRVRAVRHERELSPERPNNSLSPQYRWGGEVRVEYEFDLQLLSDNRLQVNLTGKLFEGTSEDTTDLEDVQTTQVVVPRGGSMPFFLRLYNNERRGGDWAEIRGTIRNQRNRT